MKGDKNILIVGLGGQGVSTLSKVIQKTVIQNGRFCKGAIFKGGAQKRGCVYSTVRIFNSEDACKKYSAIIPNGELDLLIGLEANEALRYHKLFHKETHFIVNNFTFPFYNERYRTNVKTFDPIKVLKENFTNLIIKDISKQSENEFGHQRMVNILIGYEVIKQGKLSIDVIDYLEAYQNITKFNYELMMTLMKLFKI